MERDAHLFVTLLDGCASFLLVTVDYEHITSSSEYLALPVERGFTMDRFEDFVLDSLLCWQDEVGWNFEVRPDLSRTLHPRRRLE